MSTAQPKPHLSATQLETYCMCPERYRRRYIEGEKIPPGIAMVVGTGLHAANRANMAQKIKTRRDLPRKEIQDLAVAGFEAGTKDGLTLTPEEHSRRVHVMADAVKNTMMLATIYADQQAPDYQPTLVEKVVTLALPGTHDIKGVLDLATEKRQVVDFKTGAKKKNQADADGSVQLTTYSAMYQAETGSPPAEVLLDVGIITKAGNPNRQVLKSQRTPRDLEVLANRINAATQAIQAGLFPPTTPGAWWCAAKWCGYWSTCRYVNSERKAAAEEGE